MLEESTFFKDDICREVLEKYNIQVDKIETINKGTANIYKLFSRNDTYVLKEFQSKYSEKDVMREINAVKYLKQNSSIPLPEFIEGKNGEYYFKHKGKTVILQRFIEGNVYNKNEGNYENLIESAHYLGEIIKGFEGIEIEDSISIQDWYSKEEIEIANQKYDAILEKVGNSKIDNKIKDDIKFKKNILLELQRTVDFSEINKITHKVSHGDYSCLQFIYDEKNKIKAIIDFIKVKKLPIIWEIARSYSYIDKDAKDGELNIKNIVDYTREVAKVTELNEYDFKYLPYVYLIQLARSPFGYEQYFKNVKNKDELLNFAFYRTNICRDLSKKAEEISNQLLSIEGD